MALEEDKVTIKEETSTVEDMCTVYIKEEDTKMENITIKEETSTVEDMCTLYIREEDTKMENIYHWRRNLYFRRHVHCLHKGRRLKDGKYRNKR